MMISEAGKQFIKSFESCRLQAYPDPGTGGQPYTCGWGSTFGVCHDSTWTQAYADQRFDNEVSKFAQGVEDRVHVPLTQNQFDALTSFAFNLGLRNLAGSTLLQDLNALNYIGAADEILRWNRAAGKVMPGLTRRRVAERELFLRAD